ncbi:related to cytochrome P450 CYP3/CYP5/CYP6/CYP9 subfamilies [Phialocephala subalpina]|uniref:Related to cytochrome P450 CYP3/CYP5/CYP6/CYP9 subfamilies n=1 Tax=Phialocephala subalpina TaxID=576137 RepID=A0A1L7WF52_9HELO|nr:related to cytochrome P450 CYP3/CYP5/CYP6/CYP9 subfamilies [Phialocephala subalpina]
MDYSFAARPSIAVVIAAILVWVSYLLGLAFYRLTLHPLSRFPGPKLAALTKWYEFYYDVVAQGQFTFQIQKLHKKYGPIVRITPWELHIEDSSHFDELYSLKARYDKYEWMAGRFGANTMTFTTAKSDLHAIRRAPLNPMFSKRSIAKFEPVIRDKVELMVKGITKAKNNGDVLVLSNAFDAFAGDVITEYCFGFCYNHLESAGFKDNFHPAFMAVSAFGHLAMQFPLMHPIMNSFPDWMTEKMTPDLHMLLVLQKKIISGEDLSHKQSSHPTIFHELLESDLPPQEKSVNRLADEAQLMIGAGLETTAWTLTVTSFHLINNPTISKKLRTELEAAIPNPNAELDSLSLEKLPYLSACIQEGIRLSYGVSARNPRISPDKPTKYKDWVIPAGTPVSMTTIDVHHDEHIYPNSRSYIPERWLGNPKTKEGENLNRYFVAFGRGARSCLGINLAHAELYLALATVFRRFTFELFDTDVSDIELAHDFFLPSPKLDSKGLRVKVTSVTS